MEISINNGKYVDRQTLSDVAQAMDDLVAYLNQRIDESNAYIEYLKKESENRDYHTKSKLTFLRSVIIGDLTPPDKRKEVREKIDKEFRLIDKRAGFMSGANRRDYVHEVESPRKKHESEGGK